MNVDDDDDDDEEDDVADEAHRRDHQGEDVKMECRGREHIRKIV
jgi:hypothetical protein